MQNSLADESSLYLKQHAENPVHWQSWGAAAFQSAKELDKPVLISIGYSSCHWCHVMAHECFENEFIADLMNEHFVCIKVDREERPDVDQVYMEAVQMIIQRGGWPLNVFCLPDGRPFFGGTYFPPEDKGNGLVPWPQLLIRIADFYKNSKEELLENAEAIQQNLIVASASSPESDSFDLDNLRTAAIGICGNHDDQYGGFGSAPKFPQAMALNFLMSFQLNRVCDEELERRIQQVITTTLKAMAHGGLYDQIGGGFSRYCVDGHWLIPHFEKMLYDNALLLSTYTRAWVRSKDPLYESIVEETIGWLNREMRTEEGLYSAALDADTEGEEGRFYVWEREQIEALLGPSLGKQFCLAYGITAEGNFENGLSVPALQEADCATRTALKDARDLLLKHRNKERVMPVRDSKMLTAWNSMLAISLAEAGFYFDRKEWLLEAQAIVDSIGVKLLDSENEGYKLQSIHYEGSGKKVDGFLHDYALYINALLAVGSKIDWVDFGASESYLNRARKLFATLLEAFSDTGSSGFYFTAKDQETAVLRRKEWFDNAVPSGNGAVLHSLSALSVLFKDVDYKTLFEREVSAYGARAKQQASAVAHGLDAIASQESMAIIRVHESRRLDAIRTEVLKHKWRPLFLIADSNSEEQLCLGRACFPLKESLPEAFQAYSNRC